LNSRDLQRIKRPFFYDCVIEDKEIYFPLANYNALCRGDLMSHQVEIVNIFPDSSTNAVAAYTGIYKYENYLLLSPHPKKEKKEFLIYDSKINHFFELENNEKADFRCKSVFERDGFLYLISIHKPGITKISMQNFSVKYFRCPEGLRTDERIAEILKVDNYIFIPLNMQRILLVFNLECEEFEYYEFPKEITSISTLAFYNDMFWITNEGNRILSWNIKLDTVEIHEKFPDDIKLFYPRNDWFLNSAIENNELWLFPGYADCILKFNLLTKQYEQIKFINEEEHDEKVQEELKLGILGRFFPSKYGTVKKIDHVIFCLSSKTRILYEIDIEKNAVKRHDFCIKNVYNGKLYPISADGIASEENYRNGPESLIESLGKQSGDMVKNCLDENGIKIYSLFK
jgi:hypothetical protein